MRTSVLRAVAALACVASLAIPASASVYVSFDYWVTNQTTNGAIVYCYHRFAPAFHKTEVARGWAAPGARIALRLPKQETTYELEAVFKKAGPDSKTVGTAATKWWLTNGSKDRLVNENGTYGWKPF